MKALGAVGTGGVESDVGPGIWDIHSPRVPSTEEMADLLRRAEKVIPIERLWVNPDCGLKTRGWSEIEAQLGDGKTYNIPSLFTIGMEHFQALKGTQLERLNRAGFLAWFDAGEGELKREADTAQGLVRVMTVHGAKGLEAPIVFRPDTCSTQSGGGRVTVSASVLPPPKVQRSARVVLSARPQRIDDVLANPNMGFADFHMGWHCESPERTADTLTELAAAMPDRAYAACPSSCSSRRAYEASIPSTIPVARTMSRSSLSSVWRTAMSSS